MKILYYIEAVVFKYWITFWTFLLVLFKRKIPKSIEDDLKDVMDELKYIPGIDKDKRY